MQITTLKKLYKADLAKVVSCSSWLYKSFIKLT